jgi:hypothetical protein
MTIMISFDASADQNYSDEPTLVTVDSSDAPFMIRHSGQPYWKLGSGALTHKLETDTNGSWSHTWLKTKIIVAVFTAGAFTFGKYYMTDGKVYSITAHSDTTYIQSNGAMILGCNDPWNGHGYWNGVINDFRIFNHAMSEDEVVSLIDEVAPDEPDTPEYMYRLAEPVTFDGSNWISTGIKPFAEPRDFTLMIAFDGSDEQDTSAGTPTLLVLDGLNEEFSIRSVNASHWMMRASNKQQFLETDRDGSWGHKWSRTKVIVAVFKNGVFSFGKYYLNHTQAIYNIPSTDGSAFTQYPDSILFVGCNSPWSQSYPGYWKGTVNDLRIYNRALSEEETAILIGEFIKQDAPVNLNDNV